MEVREDMRAANMTASIMPRAPEKYIDATVLNLLDALCTCRHQLRDELDEGDVGAAALAAADPRALVRISAGDLVSEEDPGGHPGEDHDEEGKELEVAGEDAGPLGVAHVLAGKGALDDDLMIMIIIMMMMIIINDLVAAPVPDARDGQPEDHPGPGQVRLARHRGPQQVHRVPGH